MPNNSEDTKKKFANYAKFSGLAFQMAILIIFGALAGDWLDDKQGNETPVWTIILILIAVFASLYQVITAVIKMTNEDD